MSRAQNKSTHTAAAALTYWLLVMIGLGALSALRASTPREYVPLWVGSVAGVGLGQLLGWLRLRVWLIAVMSIVLVAISPMVLAVLYGMFGTLDIGADTYLMAFLPAAVCGYLSLSERSGLVAFWFPAMLWMLVILDRPALGAFDTSRALPLVIALGALFVGFLRSRETRRTAIWGSYAAVRLAEPVSRTVLRTSPLRGASQHLWTALVGGGALLLAAWVAPHLWQKDVSRQSFLVTPPAPTPVATSDVVDAERCCARDEIEEERRERVREYLPLTHAQDGARRTVTQAPSCKRCVSGRRRVATGGATGAYPGGTSTKGYRKNGSWDSDFGTVDLSATGGDTGYGMYNGAGNYDAPAPVPYVPAPVPEPVPVPVVEPEPVAPVVAPVAPLAPVPPLPKRIAATPTPPPPPVVEAPKPAPEQPATVSPYQPTVVFVAPAAPAAPLGETGLPWRSGLALCFGGIALHLAMRALRRTLTLRHLARPFWRETLDQRVSNQWQRMLIGLRDAGIHAKTDEQPQALAKRIGIEGMETCATILERVRHGVRVDAADLDAMDSASRAVYRAARAKAGAVARAAALVRSPL